MKLIKIISGGQTGVDEAALWAAHQAGLQTGGWMPKGFRRLDNRGRQIANQYGLKEHTSFDYPRRTFMNVFDADATLIIAHRLNSPGELCTKKAIRQYNAANLIVPLDDDYSPIVLTISEIAEFVARYRIINVAGNSERTCPGIYSVTRHLLLKIFQTAIKNFEPQTYIVIDTWQPERMMHIRD